MPLTMFSHDIQKLAVWARIGVAWSITNIGRAILGQQLCCTVIRNIVHVDGIIESGNLSELGPGADVC
jgi:hypothetical protein